MRTELTLPYAQYHNGTLTVLIHTAKKSVPPANMSSPPSHFGSVLAMAVDQRLRDKEAVRPREQCLLYLARPAGGDLTTARCQEAERQR